MKALVIGHGSIGRRHREILTEFEEIEAVDIVSSRSQKCDCERFGSIKEAPLEDYDYFVIANETSKHYDTLVHLVHSVENRKILVEKPLFCRYREFDPGKNEIYVAYNLRFHPLIEKMEDLLKDEKILYASIHAGQYLPTWRPDRDYRSTYSASVQKGGGVLRDLSHELDYALMLFGEITRISALDEKASSLAIDADDLYTAIGKSEKGTTLNITLDYISKTPIRRIVIHTDRITLEADLVASTMRVWNESGDTESIQESVERNDTYRKMHEALLFGDANRVCSLKEGLATMRLIENTSHYNAKDTDVE